MKERRMDVSVQNSTHLRIKEREIGYGEFHVLCLICRKDESAQAKKTKQQQQMNQLTTWLIESNNIQKETQTDVECTV